MHYIKPTILTRAPSAKHISRFGISLAQQRFHNSSIPSPSAFSLRKMSTSVAMLNRNNPFSLPVSASNFLTVTLDFNFDGAVLVALEKCGVKLDHMIVPPLIAKDGNQRDIMELKSITSTSAAPDTSEHPFTLSELCFLSRARLPLLSTASLAHAINTIVTELYADKPSGGATPAHLPASRLRALFTEALVAQPSLISPFAPASLFSRNPRQHVPHAAYTLQAPLSLSKPPSMPVIFCAAPEALQDMGLSAEVVSKHLFNEADGSQAKANELNDIIAHGNQVDGASAPSRRTSAELGAPSQALAALLAGHNPSFALAAAHRYCGHQFGVWATQLGDGAAMTVATLAMPSKKNDEEKMEIKQNEEKDTPTPVGILATSLTPFFLSSLPALLHTNSTNNSPIQGKSDISQSPNSKSDPLLSKTFSSDFQTLASSLSAFLSPHSLLYPPSLLHRYEQTHKDIHTSPSTSTSASVSNASIPIPNDLYVGDSHAAPYVEAHYRRWLRALALDSDTTSSPSLLPSLPSTLLAHPPQATPLELQLKGSGLTTFSRSADGRKVLRSSLREHIGSATMRAMGVPTTHSPTLAIGQDTVVRDQFYNGHPKLERCAVITRTAPTFFRIGSLETGRLRDGVREIPVPQSLMHRDTNATTSTSHSTSTSTSTLPSTSTSPSSSSLPLSSASGPLEVLRYMLGAVYTDILDDYVANYWKLHGGQDAGKPLGNEKDSVYWDTRTGQPRYLSSRHTDALMPLYSLKPSTNTNTNTGNTNTTRSLCTPSVWPAPPPYLPAPTIDTDPIPPSLQAALPLAQWYTDPLWLLWRQHSSSSLATPPENALTLWDFRMMIFRVAARVAAKTAALTAQWQSVGYVHGVLNTDNISLAGVTIDYGPFGFNHQFDFFRIPNTSDSEGRYRFSEQRAVNRWNMRKLAESLRGTALPIDIVDAGAWELLLGDRVTVMEKPAGKTETSATTAAAATDVDATASTSGSIPRDHGVSAASVGAATGDGGAVACISAEAKEWLRGVLRTRTLRTGQDGQMDDDADTQAESLIDMQTSAPPMSLFSLFTSHTHKKPSKNKKSLSDAPEEGWLGPLAPIHGDYLQRVYDAAYEAAEEHIWAGKLGLHAGAEVRARRRKGAVDNVGDTVNNRNDGVLHAVSCARHSLGFMSDTLDDNDRLSTCGFTPPFPPAALSALQPLSGAATPRFADLRALAAWGDEVRTVCSRGLTGDEGEGNNRKDGVQSASSSGSTAGVDVGGDTPLAPSLLAWTHALVKTVKDTHEYYTHANTQTPAHTTSTSRSAPLPPSRSGLSLAAVDRALLLLLQLTMHMAGSEAPLALRLLAEHSGEVAAWGAEMMTTDFTSATTTEKIDKVDMSVDKKDDRENNQHTLHSSHSRHSSSSSSTMASIQTLITSLIHTGMSISDLRGRAITLRPTESKSALQDTKEKLAALSLLRPHLADVIKEKLTELEGVMLRWKIYEGYAPITSVLARNGAVLSAAGGAGAAAGGAGASGVCTRGDKGNDTGASASVGATTDANNIDELTADAYKMDKSVRDRALWAEWLRLYALRLAVDEYSLYKDYTASHALHSDQDSLRSDSTLGNESTPASTSTLLCFPRFAALYRHFRTRSQRAHAPVYIPRNALLEEAIAAAEQENDDVCVRALLTVLSDPFDLGLCHGSRGEHSPTSSASTSSTLTTPAGPLHPCPDMYRDGSRDLFQAWVAHFKEELWTRSAKSDYEICVSCSS